MDNLRFSSAPTADS
ncbi:methyltransferase domain protein, partial [Yersinia pestis PY-91]